MPVLLRILQPSTCTRYFLVHLVLNGHGKPKPFSPKIKTKTKVIRVSYLKKHHLRVPVQLQILHLLFLHGAPWCMRLVLNGHGYLEHVFLQVFYNKKSRHRGLSCGVSPEKASSDGASAASNPASSIFSMILRGPVGADVSYNTVAC